MSLTVDQVAADPAWIPIRTNAEFTELKFIHLPRERHSEVPFLEERFLPAATPSVVLPMAAVRSVLPALDEAPRFVLHSSMAASTLVARAFSWPGTSISLSEPAVLNELAALSRKGIDVAGPLDTVLRLLGRPFGPGERVVIKPGNAANCLTPRIAALYPGFRAVALHAPLRGFLRSIISKGMLGRIIYRQLYALVTRDRHLPTGFTPAQVFEQTDMQIAAMVWLLHHAEFHDYLGQFPDNLKSLNSADLLADRKVAVAAIARHLRVDLPLEDVFATGVFDRHSKERGRAFSVAERDAEHERAEQMFGEELDMVVDWLVAVARHVSIDLALPEPLPGVAQVHAPL